MSTPVVAVIGAGFIGPVHVEALRRLGLVVKGVLGISPDEAKAAASKLGLAVAYPDLGAVLADPEVTSVHVASPNRLHKEHVLAVLKAGKHVVCEKPLGMTSAESAELVAAQARHPDLVCAVNYNVRFYPLSLQARAMVRRGDVGEVFHIHGSYTQDWLLYPTDFNWRVLAAEGGHLRAIGDVGTHWLDLIFFICGLDVEAVMADLRTVHPVRLQPPVGSVETFKEKLGPTAGRREPVSITTEDYGSVLLRFKGGAKGVLTVSQVTAGRKNCLRYEIAGSKCALAWNSEAPNELWIGQRPTANSQLLRDPSLLDPSAAPFANFPGGHNEGFPDSFKQSFRAVYDDIRAGRRSPQPLYATFADGHRELVLCEAIAASHRSGTWVGVAS